MGITNFLPLAEYSIASREEHGELHQKLRVFASFSLLALYFLNPFISRYALIEFPKLFEVTTEPSTYNVLSGLASFFLGIAAVAVFVMAVIISEKLRWWEWAVLGLIGVAMLLWIAVTVGTINATTAAYCPIAQSVFAPDDAYYCYRWSNRR